MADNSDNDYGWSSGDNSAQEAAAIEAQRDADMKAAADEMASRSEQEAQQQAIEWEAKRQRDEAQAKVYAEQDARDAEIIRRNQEQRELRQRKRQEQQDARVAEEKAPEMQKFLASKKGIRERSGGVNTTDTLVSTGQASYFRKQEREEYEGRRVGETKAYSVGLGTGLVDSKGLFDPKYRGASVPINKEGRERYLGFMETQRGELEKKQKKSHAPESKAYKDRGVLLSGFESNIAGATRGLRNYTGREADKAEHAETNKGWGWMKPTEQEHKPLALIHNRGVSRDTLVATGLASYFRPGDDAAYLSRLTSKGNKDSKEYPAATSISPAGREKYVAFIEGNKSRAFAEHKGMLGQAQRKAESGKPAKPADTQKLHTLKGKLDRWEGELVGAKAGRDFFNRGVYATKTSEQIESTFTSLGKKSRIGLLSPIGLGEFKSNYGATAWVSEGPGKGHWSKPGEKLKYDAPAAAAPRGSVKDASFEDREVRAEWDGLSTRHPPYPHTKEARDMSYIGKPQKDSGEMPTISGAAAILDFMDIQNRFTDPDAAAEALRKAAGKPAKGSGRKIPTPFHTDFEGNTYTEYAYKKRYTELEGKLASVFSKSSQKQFDKNLATEAEKKKQAEKDAAEAAFALTHDGWKTPQEYAREEKRARSSIASYHRDVAAAKKKKKEEDDKEYALFISSNTAFAKQWYGNREQQLEKKLVDAHRADAWHETERTNLKKEATTDLKNIFAAEARKGLFAPDEKIGDRVVYTPKTTIDRREMGEYRKNTPFGKQVLNSVLGVKDPHKEKPDEEDEYPTSFLGAAWRRAGDYTKEEFKRPFRELQAGRQDRINSRANTRGYLYGAGLQPTGITTKNPYGHFPTKPGYPKRPPRNPVSMTEMAYFGRPFGVAKRLKRNRRGKVSKATRAAYRRSQAKARQRGAGGFLGGLGLI